MMTTSAISAPISAPDLGATPDGFAKLAAGAGFLTFVVGMAMTPLTGTPPGLGDAPADVVAYFTSDIGAHQAVVVLSAFLGLPLALLFAGVYRALARSSVPAASGWSGLFLFGAVMMSATAGVQEALLGLAVHQGEVDPDPGLLRLLSDGSNVAGASLGVWLAVAFGAVAVVVLRTDGPRWYGIGSAVIAGIGLVSIVDATGAGTDGVLGEVAFTGFIVWVVASSIVLLRRPLAT